MRLQAGKDIVDVVNGEHDATYTQRVRRRIFRLSMGRPWVVEFVSSSRLWPSGVRTMARRESGM